MEAAEKKINGLQQNLHSPHFIEPTFYNWKKIFIKGTEKE